MLGTWTTVGYVMARSIEKLCCGLHPVLFWGYLHVDLFEHCELVIMVVQGCISLNLVVVELGCWVFSGSRFDLRSFF